MAIFVFFFFLLQLWLFSKISLLLFNLESLHIIVFCILSWVYYCYRWESLLWAYFTGLETAFTIFLITLITDIICVSFSFFSLLGLLEIFHFYFSKDPEFVFKIFFYVCFFFASYCPVFFFSPLHSLVLIDCDFGFSPLW